MRIKPSGIFKPGRIHEPGSTALTPSGMPMRWFPVVSAQHSVSDMITAIKTQSPGLFDQVGHNYRSVVPEAMWQLMGPEDRALVDSKMLGRIYRHARANEITLSIDQGIQKPVENFATDASFLTRKPGSIAG